MHWILKTLVLIVGNNFYFIGYILNLRGQRAPKKHDFFVKFSKNCLKTPFSACFFACGAERLDKPGSIYCFGKARKINLVDLKKAKILPAAQNVWTNQGLFTALGELEKSIWST